MSYQTSLAAQAQSGLKSVKSAFTLDGNAGAPNAQCLNLMWERGPYGGADPIDRFGVWDVRRTNDGLFADKAFVNGIKTQAAIEALVKAGVVNPYAALAKRDLDTNPMVSMGSDGNYVTSAYDNLPVNKQVYWGGAISTAPDAGGVLTDPTDGAVLQTWPNGISLVGMSDGYTTATSPAGGTTLAVKGHAAKSGSENPFDPASFGGQLDEDTIPGATLFSLPEGPGAITTLQPSGAQTIADIQAGNIIGAVVQSGGAQAVQGIFPSAPPIVDMSRVTGASGSAPASAPIVLAASPMRTTHAGASMSVQPTYGVPSHTVNRFTTAAPFVFNGLPTGACPGLC